MSYTIPQQFYLRANVVNPRGFIPKTVFSYWNYRNTVSGTVQTATRKGAKAAIKRRYPEATFHH